MHMIVQVAIPLLLRFLRLEPLYNLRSLCFTSATSARVLTWNVHASLFVTPSAISKCGEKRGVYIILHSSSCFKLLQIYSTWFNCLLMFRSVSFEAKMSAAISISKVHGPPFRPLFGPSWSLLWLKMWFQLTRKTGHENRAGSLPTQRKWHRYLLRLVQMQCLWSFCKAMLWDLWVWRTGIPSTPASSTSSTSSTCRLAGSNSTLFVIFV